MAGIQDVMQLMGNFEAIQVLIERVFFLIVCFFLGGFAWKGWKRYQNWGLTIIASLLLGLAVLSGAILLSQVMPFTVPFVPYAIQALIVSIIYFIILRLLSGDAQKIGDLVKGETFKALKKEFEELKEQYHRLVKTLEQKKITPAPLEIKKLEESLNDLLVERGFKEFRVTSKKTFNDTKIFNVKIKEKIYEAILNLYTGELISFNRTDLNFFESLAKNAKRLFSNHKVLAGTIIALLITVLLLLQVNPQSINEIQESVDVSLTSLGSEADGVQQQDFFENYELVNSDCLSVTDLLYLINDQGFQDLSQIPSGINDELINSYPNDEIDGASQTNYQGEDYILLTSRTIPSNVYSTAIQSYMQENALALVTGGIDFCEITYQGRSISNYIRLCSIKDEEFCECTLLSEIEDYCFIFSDRLNQELSEQMGGLGEQLGGLTEQLGGILR